MSIVQDNESEPTKCVYTRHLGLSEPEPEPDEIAHIHVDYVQLI